MSEDLPETQYDPPTEDAEASWGVVQILGENPDKKEYLIEWEGVEAETGWAYRPTWEPKTSCSADLVADWKAKVKADPLVRGQAPASARLKAWDAAWKAERERRKQQAEKKKKRKLDEGEVEEGRVSKKGRKAQDRARGKSTASVASTAGAATRTNAEAGPSRGGSNSRSQNVDTSPGLARTRTRRSKSTSVAVSKPQADGSKSPSVNASGPGKKSASGKNGSDDAVVDPAPSTDKAPSVSKKKSQIARAVVLGLSDDEDETFIDPRAQDDESYRPRAAPPRKRTKKGIVPPAAKKKPAQGPVPSPPAANEVVMPPPASGSTPSKGATQDPIQQFSSPGGESERGAGGKTVRGPAQGKGAEAEVVIPSRPGLVSRMVDGEQVWVAEDDSLADEDVAIEGTNAVEDNAIEVEAVAVAVHPATSTDAAVQVAVEEVTVETTTAVPTVDSASQTAETIPVPTTDQSVQVDVAEPKKPKMVDAATNPEQSVLSTTDATNKVVTVPSAANAELTEPLSQAARITELERLLANAQAANADLERRRATTTSDNDFIREQYEFASSKAVQAVMESQRLEDELTRRKRQVKSIAKQKDAHYNAIIEKRNFEENQLRTQVKILLDQARLTDDNVRRKASLYPVVKQANDRLGAQNDELLARANNLSRRNEELMNQLELLRARQMGVVPTSDEEESAEETDTNTDSDSDSESESDDSVNATGGKRSLTELGYARRHQTSSYATLPEETTNRRAMVNGRPTTSGPGAADDDQVMQEVLENEVVVKEEPMGFQTDLPGLGYECEWRDGEVPCVVVADSRETLLEHARSHVVGLQPLPSQ